MSKHFTLVVEGVSDNPQVPAKSALELVNLEWNAENTPDIVILEAGTVLVKVGRYLAPGDRYQYRVATVAHFKEGKLT